MCLVQVLGADTQQLREGTVQGNLHQSGRGRLVLSAGERAKPYREPYIINASDAFVINWSID
jgi:hypothetical protein